MFTHIFKKRAKIYCTVSACLWVVEIQWHQVFKCLLVRSEKITLASLFMETWYAWHFGQCWSIWRHLCELCACSNSFPKVFFSCPWWITLWKIWKSRSEFKRSESPSGNSQYFPFLAFTGLTSISESRFSVSFKSSFWTFAKNFFVYSILGSYKILAQIA